MCRWAKPQPSMMLLLSLCCDYFLVEHWSFRYLVMGVTDRGWMDFNDWFNNHLLRHSPCVRPVLLLDGATTWQEVFWATQSSSESCLWKLKLGGNSYSVVFPCNACGGCGFLDLNSDEKAPVGSKSGGDSPRGIETRILQPQKFLLWGPLEQNYHPWNFRYNYVIHFQKSLRKLGSRLWYQAMPKLRFVLLSFGSWFAKKVYTLMSPAQPRKRVQSTSRETSASLGARVFAPMG